MNKAHRALIEAQAKVNETAERLEIANYYERVYNLNLSYKLVEQMHPDILEYAFRLARLDQKMHEAALLIARSWRGYRTRKTVNVLIKSRKSAMLLI